MLWPPWYQIPLLELLFISLCPMFRRVLLFILGVFCKWYVFCTNRRLWSFLLFSLYQYIKARSSQGHGNYYVQQYIFSISWTVQYSFNPITNFQGGIKTNAMSNLSTSASEFKEGKFIDNVSLGMAAVMLLCVQTLIKSHAVWNSRFQKDATQEAPKPTLEHTWDQDPNGPDSSALESRTADESHYAWSGQTWALRSYWPTFWPEILLQVQFSHCFRPFRRLLVLIGAHHSKHAPLQPLLSPSGGTGLRVIGNNECSVFTGRRYLSI